MNAFSGLTIAGDNDLAFETVRHAISSGVGEPVYHWQSTDDPLVGTAPVLILADPPERAGFALTAIEAGSKVVSLPITTPNQQIDEAIAAGRFSLISRLHGLPTMARLAADCGSGSYGRRYGVFAAHRIPVDFASELEDALFNLIVYVTSLIDSPLVRVSATTSAFGGRETAGWFIIARFDDDTIVTIEVSAVLPESAHPSGELLVEVTGSDAVLRAEPERQSVVVSGRDGVQKFPWYAEPPGFLLSRALWAMQDGRVEANVSAMQLLRVRDDAATSDRAVFTWH
jgi:hypothetical protein